MIPYTLTELTDRLTTAARSKGRKVLTCSPDLLAALQLAVPAAPPPPLGQPNMTMLTGIDIVTEPAYEPGRFRLVLHSQCHVDTSAMEATHGLCPVICDGIVSSS